MAPNFPGSSLFIAEAATSPTESLDYINSNRILQRTTQHPPKVQEKTSQEPVYKWDMVWRNVLGMIYLHGASLYGLYLFAFVSSWKTCITAVLIAMFAGQGITAGAHRLWAHRCYKAKMPLRILLAFCQTMAFQNDLYEWVRDHRVHHKFTDTDADPHNAKRGFFFSHVGWLLVRKHDDIRLKGKTVDMSDLDDDPVVQFQRKYYVVLMPVLCFVIPTLIPYYYWNEPLWNCWYVTVFRYTLTLNCTWLVNSAAHIYGNRPYDKTIGPTENKFVASLAFGEGWHNYHHVFPWDYKASELGYYKNSTTSLIDWFAKMGWAYDLKTVSKEMIEKRARRTGDGSRTVNSESASNFEQDHNHEGGIWGWGDKDMRADDRRGAEIRHKVD